MIFLKGLLRKGTRQHSASCLAAVIRTVVGCLWLIGGSVNGSSGFESSLRAGFDTNVMRANLALDREQDSYFARLELKADRKISRTTAATYEIGGSTFVSARSEDHLRQTVTIRTVTDSGFRGNLSSVFVFGPRDAVDFVNGRNSWATVQARERRQQWQHRVSLSQMWDSNRFFVRPAASLVYFDLNSRVRPGSAGYDNWIDRYDLSGGVDLGRPFSQDSEIYLGFRSGRQFQDNEGGRPSARSNRYHRIFIGFRNLHVAGIAVAVETGPTFHRYDDPDSIGESSIDSWYVKALFKGPAYAQGRWEGEIRLDRGVASTGLLSSESRSFLMRYQLPLSERSQLRIASSAKGLVYDGRPIADWIYETSLFWDFTWKIGSTLQCGVSFEAGRDRAPPKNPGREFDRWKFEAAWKLKF